MLRTCISKVGGCSGVEGRAGRLALGRRVRRGGARMGRVTVIKQDSTI